MERVGKGGDKNYKYLLVAISKEKICLVLDSFLSVKSQNEALPGLKKLDGAPVIREES